MTDLQKGSTCEYTDLGGQTWVGTVESVGRKYCEVPRCADNRVERMLLTSVREFTYSIFHARDFLRGGR